MRNILDFLSFKLSEQISLKQKKFNKINKVFFGNQFFE